MILEWEKRAHTWLDNLKTCPRRTDGKFDGSTEWFYGPIKAGEGAMAVVSREVKASSGVVVISPDKNPFAKALAPEIADWEEDSSDGSGI